MLALRWRSCFFSTLGKREGSDPWGESLRKNFKPGLRSVEKKESADFLMRQQISNLSIFPAKTKKWQINRQADDRFHFPGHSNLLKCQHVDRFEICQFFPPKNKMTDEQTDSQQIWFSGTPYYDWSIINSLNLNRFPFDRSLPTRQPIHFFVSMSSMHAGACMHARWWLRLWFLCPDTQIHKYTRDGFSSKWRFFTFATVFCVFVLPKRWFLWTNTRIRIQKDHFLFVYLFFLLTATATCSH